MHINEFIGRLRQLLPEHFNVRNNEDEEELEIKNTHRNIRTKKDIEENTLYMPAIPYIMIKQSKKEDIPDIVERIKEIDKRNDK